MIALQSIIDVLFTIYLFLFIVLDSQLVWLGIMTVVGGFAIFVHVYDWISRREP